jgi:hypothetical protein
MVKQIKKEKMKKKNLLFAAIAIFVSLFQANSQSNNSFCLTIGGAGNESAVGIAKTNDNGSIICGYTNSYGQGLYDCYFVKLDSIGQIEWTKTLGGTNDDKAYSIVQTMDGGYAFTGITQSFGAGGNDVFIGKLSSTGSLSWTKTIGGPSSDYGNSIIETSDGGLAVAGWYGVTGVNYDAYLIKMDASGNITFSNTYGGAGEDVAYSIFQNLDGSYILSGYTKTYGAGLKDCYVLKITSTGSLSWSKTIGGSLDEESFSIIQTSDGGYALAGVTQSYGSGGNDCYLVKLNSSGNLLWTKTIGGLNSDYFKSIQQRVNNNIVACGWYGINADNYDLYVAELDNLGSFISGKTVGSSGVETGQCFVITDDNCLITAGYSDIGSGLDDMYIVQFDSSNNICSSCNPANSVGSFSNGGVLSTGGAAGSAGSASSGGTLSSGGVLTLICQNIVTTSVSENVSENLFSVYPNPAKSQINVKADANLLGSIYTVYDNIGKVVLSGKINSENIVIELGNLSGGVYLLSVGENLKQTFKVIKE